MASMRVLFAAMIAVAPGLAMVAAETEPADEHDLSRFENATVVSGLPLLNKPMRTRIRLINEAFGLMHGNAPFVQFTYSMAAPPIPKGLSRIAAQASERIWMNLPPARVWCYRRALVS